MIQKFAVSLFVGLLILITPQLLNSSVYAEDCGGPTPNIPASVRAVSGPKVGQITLFWNGSNHANRYAIAYGTGSNNYIYGATNIGNENSRSYTVTHLVPGVKYYFRVAAARDCNSSGFSSEVWAVTKSGQTSIVAKDASADSAKTTSKPVSQAPVGGPSVPESMPVSGPVGKQNLWAKSGPNYGEVTLYWQNVDSAEDYHLVYGTKPGMYQYGALNIGKSGRFTVSYLVPGAKYYFALIPMVANVPLYTTPSVGMRAKIKVEMVNIGGTESTVKAETKAVTVTPKASPTPTTKAGTMSPTPAPEEE